MSPRECLREARRSRARGRGDEPRQMVAAMHSVVIEVPMARIMVAASRASVWFATLRCDVETATRRVRCPWMWPSHRDDNHAAA